MNHGAMAGWNRAVRRHCSQSPRPSPRPSPRNRGERGICAPWRNADNGRMTQPAPAPQDDVAIRMIGVNKWYGDFHVLRDINLDVAHGEKIVLCGPSGSGKSTLIRCINRLEEHQTGRLVVDGVELTDA